MKRVLQFLVLPGEITDFERRYLARVNRVALAFFAMHVPVFTLIAWLNHTGPGLAAALTSAVVAGPAVAYVALGNPRHVSMVYGVTAMFMGGLLVHFGQGPVQIEMHFYFFSLVAMCAVFGNPLVIVAAAVTVALHHFVVWVAFPRSVFNYEAAWWVVGVHAAFVVLESVAATFIARSFFDNVIGLEKIVEARTQALDTKNRDLRLLLDNVDQGFLTIDARGALAAERSAVVDGWLGAPSPGESWFDCLAKTSASFAAASRLAWDEVVAGVMPVEVTIDQMPRDLVIGASQYRIAYRPIGAAEPYERYLVIVTDVTNEVARELVEIERREAMAVFERMLSDRSGFEGFFEDGSSMVDALVRHGAADFSEIKRAVHTLKGNAALFGLPSVARICERIEDLTAELGAAPPPAVYLPLAERWARLAADVEKLLGHRASTIEVDEQQYAALEASVRSGEPAPVLLRRVRGLKLEATHKRLKHFAEQARRIAERLGKADVKIRIEDHGVRVDARRWAGFWGGFVHAVRNAIDHGIELPETRAGAGKPEEGTLTLRTYETDAGGVVVEIVDDGRGIDWDAVSSRAARAGLPTSSRDDLVRALFADGVSTAAAITDISGRGVGMGALLEGTRALGGDVDVKSESGRGTTFRFVFPPRAARSVESIAPPA